jgi:hypothetical protein
MKFKFVKVSRPKCRVTSAECLLVMSRQVQQNDSSDRPCRQQNVVIECLLNLHANGLGPRAFIL